MVLDIGRVCVKTAGREAGRVCVVIDRIDETYVMVTGPKDLTKVKRRKCNIAHLEPMEFQLSLEKNAPDTEVAKLLKEKEILDKLVPGKPVRAEKPMTEFPTEIAPKKPLPHEEKRGLRERLLGRAKKEEKKPEKPKEEPKKPEKPKPAKEKKEKPGKKPKEKPKGKKQPAKKAKPRKKK